ncbi:hypothetical protein E2562_003258 [Oryza meyeriana var. granulata]|uniref:Uncharacterized protein n=1 Tax=Oryza meyeriana var. granulata TaxID=110450 RepID=A0A6G1EUY5_9ORYZ|nr:hypothetical protein E2562_003258 [Oryza meyeriana var. granulata]
MGQCRVGQVLMGRRLLGISVEPREEDKGRDEVEWSGPRICARVGAGTTEAKAKLPSCESMPREA